MFRITHGIVATLGGVEPPTSCFVGKRSIQLSYRVVASFF